MAGEQRVLELRAGRCPRSRPPRGTARSPDWMCAMALRRSSSFTGTEVQPDSRSWPTVAGAGCAAVDVMPPTYRRPRPRPRGRTVGTRCGTGSLCAVRLRWFLSMTLVALTVALAATPRHDGARRDLAGGGRGRRPAPHLAGGRLRRRRVGGRRAVPGHWRSDARLRRHRRPAPLPAAVRRDGPGRGAAGVAHLRRASSTRATSWLDGSYLGDTEGYFAPHTFEVTEALRARGEHHLAVEVTCSRQDDLTAKRNITGVFQHWDCLDPDWNPGGMWRTGPPHRDRARAHQPPACAVPRGHPGAGGAACSAPPSTATPRAPCACTARSARSTTMPTSRWPPAPTRWSGR